MKEALRSDVIDPNFIYLNFNVCSSRYPDTGETVKANLIHFI